MAKTPAPITGGKSWPPSEAVFSTAPATTGRNPTRFISGMVNEPVETMLARLLPEIEPKDLGRHHAPIAVTRQPDTHPPRPANTTAAN